MAELEAIIPKELPAYRFNHPYGSIAVYHPTNHHVSPERILLLLEQAKFDLLQCHVVSVKKSDDE